ncbi:MAG: hypothetical protein ACOYM3_07175 [Terrimicrobiaceae bacterium]
MPAPVPEIQPGWHAFSLHVFRPRIFLINWKRPQNGFSGRPLSCPLEKYRAPWRLPDRRVRRPAFGRLSPTLPENQRVALPLTLKFKLAATDLFKWGNLPPCLRVSAHFSDQMEARVELGFERSGVHGAVGIPHTQIQPKQRTYLHFWS